MVDRPPPAWRIVSFSSQPMGSTARVRRSQHGYETLRGSLIASVRSRTIGAGVALLSVAFAAVAMPLLPSPALTAEIADSAPALEPTSFWARTERETAIWSGWDK